MRVLVAVVLAACGRIDFTARTGDAAIDARAIDAAAPPVDACTAFGPWSTPQVVTELSSPTATDYGPALSADELEVVFHSDRAGGTGSFDLYLAERADRTLPWDPPARLATLASTDRDEGGDFSTDGLTLYFDSARTGTGATYEAHRPDRATAFAGVTELAALGDLEGVNVTADGAELFAYARASNILARATAFESATPTIELLAQFPTGSGYPVLSGDALTMYYTKGGNIFRASRPDRTAAFAIVGMEPTVSTGHETDVDVSRDGLTMMFSSNLSGNYEIYRATRSCP